jgi:predicted O-methyltransferase YrrM
VAKSLYEDWIVIGGLADIIISHPRVVNYSWVSWAAKGCIVDIGFGYSTYMLAHYARKWGVRQYTCDIGRMKQLHEKHLLFQCTSSEFVEQFDDYPALVFLDGSHHREDVLVEINCFLPRLVEGGVIFIHDTYPPYEQWAVRGKHCGDVFKVRQMLEKREDIQVFTWPYTANNCGLTMVMKKQENRIFCRE